MPATVARIRRRPESPAPAIAPKADATAATTPAKPVAKTPAKPKAASSPSARSLASLGDKMHLASDPNRLRILFTLAEGERFVGELVDLLAISQPAASHCLALLRIAGIIEMSRRGKNNFYSLTVAGRALQEALAALVD